MTGQPPCWSVRAADVRLSYPIYGVPQLTLRGMLAERLQRGTRAIKPRAIAALKGISFEAYEGDRIAVIGPNGAGKSTLLRVICGIYQADAGIIERNGSVIPLLGSLPGVSPDATGYENITLSAYSLGLSRSDLPRLIAEVEDFSELGEFLALPIKTYSSGMVTRLFFGIVTSLSADIFVMDEFSFATGDASFRERAQRRAQDLLDRAKTVFVASHDNSIVRAICNKAIYLSKGELIAFGETSHVLGEYEATIHQPGHLHL